MRWIAVLGFLLAAATAWGHGKEHHGPKPPAPAGAASERIMGTLQSLDRRAMTVRSVDGKEVSIAVEEATDFQRSGRCASAHELQVGSRVVVHARRVDAALVAVLVKFGRQPPAPGR